MKVFLGEKEVYVKKSGNFYVFKTILTTALETFSTITSKVNPSIGLFFVCLFLDKY